MPGGVLAAGRQKKAGLNELDALFAEFGCGRLAAPLRRVHVSTVRRNVSSDIEASPRQQSISLHGSGPGRTLAYGPPTHGAQT